MKYFLMILLVVGVIPTARVLAGEGDYDEKIPGSVVTFKMIGLPAGKVTVHPMGGAAKEVEIKKIWIGQKEVTWDEYDIFAYRMDLTEEQKAKDVDGASRPSKPYGAPDRGFGHHNFPAGSVAFHAAQAYCEWLSKKTGHKYRLPTEAEWEYACRAGAGETMKFKDAKEAGKFAWIDDNSDGQTHETGKKEANAWGLYDMLGNVAEWVTPLDAKGQPVAMGGSYIDGPEDVNCEARKVWKEEWQASDPQNPKSIWWLSDGAHVGLRVVREE